MSIVVTCKNGHRLRAPDRKAGTVGRCPACGAEVEIPKLSKVPTDSSILRILGVGQELRRKMDEYDAEHDGTTDENAQQNTPPPAPDLPPPSHKKKVCPQCDWEIDAGYKICPHCRYYFMH
ncbi:MAG: hypothetical protein IJL92_09655 [Thermoguttaceae bacterium]|nr:hypothetical protein [Thermoguttaceae bacterium]